MTFQPLVPPVAKLQELKPPPVATSPTFAKATQKWDSFLNKHFSGPYENENIKKRWTPVNILYEEVMKKQSLTSKLLLLN